MAHAEQRDRDHRTEPRAPRLRQQQRRATGQRPEAADDSPHPRARTGRTRSPRPTARAAPRPRRRTRAARTARRRGDPRTTSSISDHPARSNAHHTPSTDAAIAAPRNTARRSTAVVSACPHRNRSGKVHHARKPRRRSGVPIHACNVSTPPSDARNNPTSNPAHTMPVRRSHPDGPRQQCADGDPGDHEADRPPGRARRDETLRVDRGDNPDEQRRQRGREEAPARGRSRRAHARRLHRVRQTTSVSPSPPAVTTRRTDPVGSRKLGKPFAGKRARGAHFPANSWQGYGVRTSTWA